MLSKTLTIMFIDLQGYTSLTSQNTREEHQLFITEIHAFVEKHAQSKRGRLVKTMGDGFLITFESPTDAINCGLAIQEEIGRRNMNVLDESHWLRLRVGISTGEVSVDENNDVYGDAVNIAARIEKRCDPNEVFISESTYLAMNRSEVNALDLGALKFKNVTEDVRVFKILKEKKIPGEVPGSRSSLSVKGWIIAGGVAVLLIVVAGLFFAGRAGKTSVKPSSPGDKRVSMNPMDSCRENVERYCGDVQPGEGRIIRCLKEHSSSLDPACASTLSQGENRAGVGARSPSQSSGDAPQPFLGQGENAREKGKDFLSSCDEEVRNYCGSVQHGGGRIVQCLKENVSQLSRTCQEALPEDMK
ncbi:MAG: adenylate/guanylate cyclase domain-containing protein [Candidatus Omnitrophota bacterium]